jgi:hypothetical protein
MGDRDDVRERIYAHADAIEAAARALAEEETEAANAARGAIVDDVNDIRRALGALGPDEPRADDEPKAGR